MFLHYYLLFLSLVTSSYPFSPLLIPSYLFLSLFHSSYLFSPLLISFPLFLSLFSSSYPISSFTELWAKHASRDMLKSRKLLWQTWLHVLIFVQMLLRLKVSSRLQWFRAHSLILMFVLSNFPASFMLINYILFLPMSY